MVAKEYLAQVIVDIGALTILALIYIIYYGFTKPYEKSILKNS